MSLKPMLRFGFIELLCVQQVENENLQSYLTTQPKGMKHIKILKNNLKEKQNKTKNSGAFW